MIASDLRVTSFFKNYFKDKDVQFSMSDHILSVCDKKVKLTREDFEKAKF